MKRMISMVAGLCLIAGLALAQDVTSVNVVGYNTIDMVGGKYYLVTISFESFGNSTLQDLIGTQIPDGSVAFIWDRNAKAYVQSNLGRGTWGTPGGTNVILRGDAFWLKPAGTATNSVRFHGEVPTSYNNASTTTVRVSSPIDAVGYAYPVDMVWTNSQLSKSAPDGSVLYFWSESSQGYTLYSKGRGAWGSPVGFTIQAGRAFWIKTTNTIDWTEAMPYNL
jgi:hypothetical protein